jgi:TrpR-related protein YerC/YecD
MATTANPLDIVIARCYISAMKRKDVPTSPGSSAAPDRRGEGLDRLLDALLAMKTPGELRALLEDLCTPAELEAIADRWRVVPLLIDQVPYREIHDRTGVSVTTVGRIARCLGLGAGGYRLAAERVLGGAEPPPHRPS